MLAGALCLAWVSSGTLPLGEALDGAFAPSDFATDFVPAARLWRGESTRVDVNTGNAESALLGAPPYAAVGVPYGAHPPPSVLLVAALVPLGFRAASWAWLALSLGGLALLAWVVTDSGNMPGRRRLVPAVIVFAALALWPPVLHNIARGQWSLIIAGLLAGAWWAAAHGRDRLAGALVALAGSFKIMPLLALAAFARPGRGKATIAGAAVTLAIVIALSTVIVGPAAWVDFVRSAPVNTEGWQTGPANTLSLWGLLARLFVGGPYARPLTTAPALVWLARCLWAFAAVGLVVTARQKIVRESPARAFAVWSVLAVLLGPLSWSHTATWLLLPTALVARSSESRSRVVLMIAVIVLSIPRSTLFALAGSLPVSPAGGLVLAAHLGAALIILMVAVNGPAAPNVQNDRNLPDSETA